MTRRVLILGGTIEARGLAQALAEQADIEPIYSLAGRTSSPALPDCAVRTGGFGGAAGLRTYIEEKRVAAVVNGAHPFAAQITRHSDTACASVGVPALRLLRAPWQPQPGDNWIEVADLQAAAAQFPALASRIFLSTGIKDLDAFADIDAWFLVRTIEKPSHSLPLAHCTLIRERGPFAVEDEAALLAKHRIGAIVTKNSGGAATQAKLTAARRMGLLVVMVARPAPAQGPTVESVAAAIDWLGQHLQ